MEQPDPKHHIPQGLKPREVYQGVPLLAFQDETMPSDVYGLSIVWYHTITDVGRASLAKQVTLLHEAKQLIDLLLEAERLGAFNPDGTLKEK